MIFEWEMNCRKHLRELINENLIENIIEQHNFSLSNSFNIIDQ